MSSEFVNPNYFFCERSKVFTISARDRLVNRRLFDPVFKDGLTDPERQSLLQSLAEEMRPELKGCVVYCFQYQAHAREWSLAVSHGSLPSVPPDEELPRERFIPESWRDKEPML